MKKLNTAELIGKSSRLLNNSLSNKLTKLNMGITSEQWVILQILSAGPKTQKELGEITLKNKSSINSLVSYLLNSNLIDKNISKNDKRSTIISISEQGIATQKKAVSIALNSISEALSGFSESEIKELNNYLVRINSNFKKER